MKARTDKNSRELSLEFQEAIAALGRLNSRRDLIQGELDSIFAREARLRNELRFVESRIKFFQAQAQDKVNA